MEMVPANWHTSFYLHVLSQVTYYLHQGNIKLFNMHSCRLPPYPCLVAGLFIIPVMIRGSDPHLFEVYANTRSRLISVISIPLAYGIPLFIILFCYAAILKTVWTIHGISVRLRTAETQMEAANSDVEDGSNHCYFKHAVLLLLFGDSTMDYQRWPKFMPAHGWATLSSTLHWLLSN